MRTEDESTRKDHPINHHQHEHVGHDKHVAHDKHAGHSPALFRSKFWISLLLTTPIVLYSPMVHMWLGLTMPQFPGAPWLPAVLGTFLFFYGGMVFLRGAVAELQDRLPGMMTLISLAISVAFVYSLYTSITGIGSDFWWELATLITIMLLGHWIEMRAVMNAEGALHELAKLLPDEAEVVTPSGTKTIPVGALKEADVVLVRPGAQIPADGVVVEGESDVNESMLTGESKTVKKTEATGVVAGSVNGDGSLKVKVIRVGEATALAGIMRLVAEAQTSKSRAQILADRAAFYLTIVALSAGVLTFLGWLSARGHDVTFALERAVTVLVIACPHALGLAIPLVTAISTTLAARNGLLVRQRLALESARNVDVVIFDKTGTLTEGKQGVVDVWSVDGLPAADVLALAAAANGNSEHIIARAIVAEAAKNHVPLPPATQFKALPGRGVQALVGGWTVQVGGPQLLAERHAELPEALTKRSQEAGRDGKTVVYVLNEATLVGAIALADVIRKESYAAVRDLKANKIRVAMLTGDSNDVAAWVAKELGIDRYFAQVLPEDKAETVKRLQRDGSRVAMVGDGVNDAPALTQADIGIAIGAGTDVAIESAGIILASDDPRGVAKIIRLSKASYRKMVQNLVWATGYNAIAIPLAAGVFAAFGILVTPAVGAVLMSLSTVIVAINAQFLRGLRL